MLILELNYTECAHYDFTNDEYFKRVSRRGTLYKLNKTKWKAMG